MEKLPKQHVSGALSWGHELPTAGGCFALSDLNQVVDRHDRNVALSRKPQQLVASRHMHPIATANLAEHSSRFESRHPHQVNGRFSMALAR